MAGIRDIKSRIKSVKNTKKITYAMKLVSATKLKKAQDAKGESGRYTESLINMLSALQSEIKKTDISHPLMKVSPKLDNALILIIGADRGLSGSYNSNVNRETDKLIMDLKARNPEVNIDSILLGKKPSEHFKAKGYSFLECKKAMPDDIAEWPINELFADIETDFVSNKYDQVYMIFTKFKNALSMKAVSEMILPMTAPDVAEKEEDTLFEPDAETVFTALIPRILKTRLVQAGLDSKASEHAARMTSMDSATNNAGDLVDTLTLKMNKLRQSNITSQLLDILGGAQAQD